MDCRSFLSNDLERLQKRAMSIIFPQVTYADALAASKLPTLYDRRNILTVKLFNTITSNENHKLHSLLPEHNTCEVNLRNKQYVRLIDSKILLSIVIAYKLF